MKHTSLIETRAWQARFIGRISLLPVFAPLDDDDANAAYVVKALDELATMTRSLDTTRGQDQSAAFGSQSPDPKVRHRANTVYVGTQICARALGESFNGLAILAGVMGVKSRDDVQDAVKRALGARKVLVRRELSNSADALIAVANAHGMEPSTIINEVEDGKIGKAFRESLKKCRDMGVSKDFVDRINARLGL